MISKLDVICPTDLCRGVIRRRWERALPLEFQHVQFLDSLDGRETPLLIASNSYPFGLRAPKARTFIYLSAAEMQAYWIYHRKPPPLSVKRRMRRARAFAKTGEIFLAMSRLAAHGIAEEFRVPPERIAVVPPPVDTELFSPLGTRTSKETMNVLFIGSDFKRKGGDAILPLLNDRDLASCHWTFVTSQSGVSGSNVTVVNYLLPESSQLVQLIQQADVFLLPTTADTHSLAALEALACGVPVIMRNMGAANEIVEEGVNGFLIDRSEPAEIKQALLNYVRNRELILEHGRRGREKVVRENALTLHARKIREAIEG